MHYPTSLPPCSFQEDMTDLLEQYPELLKILRKLTQARNLRSQAVKIVPGSDGVHAAAAAAAAASRPAWDLLRGAHLGRARPGGRVRRPSSSCPPGVVVSKIHKITYAPPNDPSRIQELPTLLDVDETFTPRASERGRPSSMPLGGPAVVPLTSEASGTQAPVHVGAAADMRQQPELLVTRADSAPDRSSSSVLHQL